MFLFYAEIQNGHQKWQENNFWEKSPVDSADNLRVKNFVEITLSRSISEINRFLHFTQKFKMAAKSGGKTTFAKSHFSQGYCIHLPNMKRICLMAAKLLRKENADPANLADPAESLLPYTIKRP